MNITSGLRRTITPGKTLLFLDEIQATPEILSKLRWFYEELPEQHVVAAGSLLDFALADHAFSMPVGRITYGHLEPMTFAEFLLACGEEHLLKAIRACTLTAGLHASLHAQAMELVRIYTLVGGMPAAVKVHWSFQHHGSPITAAGVAFLVRVRSVAAASWASSIGWTSGLASIQRLPFL